MRHQRRSRTPARYRNITSRARTASTNHGMARRGRSSSRATVPQMAAAKASTPAPLMSSSNSTPTFRREGQPPPRASAHSSGQAGGAGRAQAERQDVGEHHRPGEPRRRREAAGARDHGIGHALGPVDGPEDLGGMFVRLEVERVEGLEEEEGAVVTQPLARMDLLAQLLFRVAVDAGPLVTDRQDAGDVTAVAAEEREEERRHRDQDADGADVPFVDAPLAGRGARGTVGVGGGGHGVPSAVATPREGLVDP